MIYQQEGLEFPPLYIRKDGTVFYLLLYLTSNTIALVLKNEGLSIHSLIIQTL